MSAPRYDAVVFDNDGVLTEPTDGALLRRATQTAFATAGADPAAEHVAAIDDSPTPGTIRAIAREYDLDPAAFWRRHEAAKAAAQCEALEAGEKALYPDVEAALSLPAALGIVSNNQHATIEHILRVFDLGDAFDTHHGRDPTLEGMGRRKPDPHYLERALGDLGTRNALYVGDSRVDVAAANAAGVDSAFVRRPHREGYSLDAEPTYRIDGLADLRGIVLGNAERPSPGGEP